MDKKGVSTIVFVLLIPIIFVITLIIADTFISYTNKKSYQSVTENIITEIMNNEDIYDGTYYEEIKKLYEKKGYETNMLIVEEKNDKILVENEHFYFGLFSSLTNKNGMDAKVNILGVEFNVKKGSKTILKLEVSRNELDEIIFEYIEE